MFNLTCLLANLAFDLSPVILVSRCSTPATIQMLDAGQLPVDDYGVAGCQRVVTTRDSTIAFTTSMDPQYEDALVRQF